MKNKLSPWILGFFILMLWVFVSSFAIVPKYLLPSPFDIIKAFLEDFSLIMEHTKYTLTESLIGISLGTALAFFLSLMMDRYILIKNAIYPYLVLSQTIPTVAIAPLLVLWMGYNLAPKITLVTLTTFFPIAVSLLDAFEGVDRDSINLLKSMGANNVQIYKHVKLPYALPAFISGMKISVSYAIVGAVIAEWLGGFNGLGVYMTRVRKSYRFDKMFAVIYFISILSLIAIKILDILEKKFVKKDN